MVLQVKMGKGLHANLEKRRSKSRLEGKYVWVLNCGRERLLEYGFIRDQSEDKYTQNPDVFENGGEIYINDGEDFFRAAQFCMELYDDSYFRSEHVADIDDKYLIQDLVDRHIVNWKENNKSEDVVIYDSN